MPLCRLVVLLPCCLVALLALPSKSQGDLIISGSIPFDSFAAANPGTLFGGLVVNATDPLEFSFTYDETTADSEAAANLGDYHALTEVTLTIGTSTVTMMPGAGVGTIDTANSFLQVHNNAGFDRVSIAVTDFATGIVQMDLTGPTTLFSNDQINPTIGGTTTLNLSDFTAGNASVGGISDSAVYSILSGTVTFPNSTAIPEPSSFLFLGLVACGGMAYRRKEILKLLKRK